MSPVGTAVPHRPSPALVRLMSVPIVAVLLLSGGWVTGALVTNNFTVSTVLTAAWVGLVGLACVGLVLRRREMWPALAAFAVTATVAGVYLGAETFIDDKVDEDVVTAQAPAREPPAREPLGARTPPARPTNVLLGRGRFESLEHETTGVAQVIEVRGRRRFLTLT